nr:DUF2125 domain-containing protein [uncultured Lichenicoccus sp.]
MGLLLSLAVLLLGVDTLGWLYAQHVLDRRLLRLQIQAGDAGWRFSAASTRRGGWPLAATRSFQDPGLHRSAGPGAGADDNAGIGWSGARLTAAISVLHPTDMTIRLGGGQMIRLGGDTLRFRGDDVMLAIPLQARTSRIGFDARRLRLLLAPGASTLRMSRLEGSVRWTADAIALSATTRGVGVADAAGPGLDADAGDIELSLVGPFGAKDATWTDRLRGWRDKDGRLIVTRGALQWPDARIQVAGNATLDSTLHPDGAFSLHLVGADALVGRSVRSGLVSNAQATSIRAILGLIAAASDARNGGSLDLPLDLHAGTLALGRIPLLRLSMPDPGPAATMPVARMPSP